MITGSKLFLGAGDHRVRRAHGDGGVPPGHHRADRAEHRGADHQRGDARLRLHEDGAGQPAGRDAHLLQERRGVAEERPAHLHVPGGRPEEEHDHLGHRAAAGEVVLSGRGPVEGREGREGRAAPETSALSRR